MSNRKTYRMLGVILIIIAITMLISSYGSRLLWFMPKINIDLPGIEINNDTGKDDVLQEKSSELGSVDEIEIKSVSEDIIITLVKGDEVKAKLSGRYSKKTTPELKLDKHGDRIKINLEYPKLNFSIGSFTDNGRLEVSIPESYSEVLRINSTSGQIKAEGLDNSKIEAATISGSILFEKVKTENFEINSTSGRVDIASVEADDIDIRTISGSVICDTVETEKISIKTTSGGSNINDFVGGVSFLSVSGGIEINANELNEDMDIKTTSGGVRINIPEDSDFEFDYNTLSGSFSSNFEYTKKNSSKMNGSIEGFYGEKEQKIEVNTVSGALSIHH